MPVTTIKKGNEISTLSCVTAALWLSHVTQSSTPVTDEDLILDVINLVPRVFSLAWGQDGKSPSRPKAREKTLGTRLRRNDMMG